MVMPNFRFGAAASASPPIVIAPDNAAISTSDFVSVSVNSARIRFTRGIVDGQGFENANPGARVRFVTNAPALTVHLQYTNLVSRPDTYNGVGTVLVNGALATTFDRVQGVAGPLSVPLTFGSIASRTVEVVMPYCASVDFLGVDLAAGSSISQAAARPTTRYVAIGDSITHGFNASAARLSWPFLLAQNKSWTLINTGYGSRQVNAADGTRVANLSPTVATYLIGYNNFAAQTPLATFRTEYEAFLTNFRAINTVARLYCITPTWTPNSFGALTIEQYRQQIRDAVAASANPMNVLVEGASLATNSVTHFPDNVHPNDAGSAAMAAALSPIVVP